MPTAAAISTRNVGNSAVVLEIGGVKSAA